MEANGRFINHSPGCRQGTILAPVAAWHFCPAAGPFRPWDILERRRDLGVARGFVTSDATASESADIDSVERGDSCRTERSRFRSRKRALREQATSEWRAEEARALGPATERVTTCHGDHGQHGAGHVQRRVTAPGHGGHGAGHGIHGASHSDHGAESGQRVRNPRRRRPPGQRLSPRAGGWDKKQCIISLFHLT